MTPEQDAAALEQAIAALDPDAIDSDTRRDAQRIAMGMTMVPVVGGLAAVIARTLAGCVKGEVEPHHAKWRLASAALTLRQECDRVAAGGAASDVAINGACYELAVLFPKAADAAPAPTVADVDLVHPSTLVRKP